MKLTTALAAMGGAGKLLTVASNLAIILGVVYLADCRFSSKTQSREAVDSCYFTAMPLMGLGVTGRGAYALGYNTYNPALRKEDEPATGRDEHGRFTKRERG
jgi:hypothetical protein